MPKKSEPTPLLGKPNRDAKSFTYSENKLLDQITTEIMEAWKKDLTILKQHYGQALKTHDQIRTVVDLVEEKFPKLEEFLQANEFTRILPKIQEDIEAIKGNYGYLQLSIKDYDKDEKITKTDIKKLQQSIDEIKYQIARSPLLKQPKKPFWKALFKL